MNTEMQQVLLKKRDQVFSGFNISGLTGLEIGPLCRPLISKADSKVYYVDHCSKEELKKKYAGNQGVILDDIVPVDFIWADQSLSAMLGNQCPVDYVLASHVIEHVPDLIGWLKEMHDVLREGGVLALIIPDKRFTFDIYRRTSSFEEIQLAHAELRRRPGLRCIMDHFANVVKADAGILWDDYTQAEDLKFFHTPDACRIAAENYAKGLYIDVHCWVFTPWMFLQTIGRIIAEAGLGFDLQYFQTTPTHSLEFYCRFERVSKSKTDWNKQSQIARDSAFWPKKLGRVTEFLK